MIKHTIDTTVKELSHAAYSVDALYQSLQENREVLGKGVGDNAQSLMALHTIDAIVGQLSRIKQYILEKSRENDTHNQLYNRYHGNDIETGKLIT